MKSPFLNAITESMRVKFYAEKTIKAYIPMLLQDALSGASSETRARRNMRKWLFPFRLVQRSAGFRACAP